MQHIAETKKAHKNLSSLIKIDIIFYSSFTFEILSALAANQLSADPPSTIHCNPSALQAILCMLRQLLQYF